LRASPPAGVPASRRRSGTRPDARPRSIRCRCARLCRRRSDDGQGRCVMAGGEVDRRSVGPGGAPIDREITRAPRVGAVTPSSPRPLGRQGEVDGLGRLDRKGRARVDSALAAPRNDRQVAGRPIGHEVAEEIDDDVTGRPLDSRKSTSPSALAGSQSGNSRSRSGTLFATRWRDANRRRRRSGNPLGSVRRL
jgi:hypothetical protein